MEKEKSKTSWFSPLATGQIIMMINIALNIFFKSDTPSGNLKGVSILFFIPAIILWTLPVLTLRRFGDVSQSGSFLATTEMVDKGIYRIIRHPQYLGFMLLSIGMALFYQLDITIFFSVITIILLAFGIKEEERMLISQFGEEYENYQKKVPSLNLFAGLFRLLKR
jgi:protein-S-isoprenylcysteine O-methyltransferase Ste14